MRQIIRKARSGYIVAPDALAGVFGIWRGIAEDNEEAADRVQEELYSMFDSLARMPHRRADYTKKSFLFFPIYSYPIVYQPHTEPVEILAIVHGRGDVNKVLRKRDL